MLPNTYLFAPIRRSRVVDTALAGKQVEIYRSPYAEHPLKIFHDIGNRGKDAVDVSRVTKKEKRAVKQINTTKAGDGSTGILTGSYTAMIDNIIKPVKSAIFPKLPAQKLCPVLNNVFGKCDILGAVEGAMAAAGGQLSACKAPPAGNQILPTVQLAPFSDARPLPASFSLAQIAPEGASYYWLYRMLQNLESWSVCNAANPGTVFQVPAGWELVSTVPLPQGNASPPSIQFMAIMLNRATSHLVILNRGTMSGFEWLLDFSYNQTTQILPNLFSSPIHQGFATALNVMWNNPNGGVAATLQDLVITQKVVKSITVSGHSLGAGVSTLMSYAVQGYLAQNGVGNIVVDAALFAPPNVGPPAFAQDFNTKVNGRRVAWQTDVVTEVPCDPSMFTCKNNIARGFPITTNQPGDVSSWAFSEVGGTVLLVPEGMPFDQASWAQIINVPLGANAVPFLISTHVCSYLCYFSQYSDGANGEWCWLSQLPPGSAGTACAGFPVKNGYPDNNDD
jgi:Lipase (class 3)